MFKEIIDSNAHCVHIMLALSHLNEVLVVLDDDVVLVELPVHVRLRPALSIGGFNFCLMQRCILILSKPDSHIQYTGILSEIAAL